MKRYMKENYDTLMRYSGYGVSGRKLNEIYKIFEYIYNELIFINKGGYEGEKERLDKVNFYTSFHNNNIELQLGNDVRGGDIKYTYIFGCPKIDFIRLIGYFKNNDTEHNLIRKEYIFDNISLKDFIHDRVYNYLNELESEDEWMDKFEYPKQFEELEEELE